MKTTAPLSKTQYSIFAECVSHQNEVFYNLPYLYVIDGSVDADRLCRAIETAIKAHPTIFTRIALNDDDEPFQYVDMEKEEFSLDVEHATDIETEKQNFVQPFKLYGGRLFHTKLMRDEEHVYWFLDIHHIISDATSHHIIINDVETVYNGGTLAPEEMTIQELALEEAEKRKTNALEEGRQWYAKNFDCNDTFTQFIPDLEIPGSADDRQVRILAIDMQRVNDFCKANDIKKSAFFTAAFSYLLAKYNNDQEALFDTIYSGRTNPKVKHSVGMTVRKVPVYAKFNNETTVIDFLKDNQEQMRGCRKHDVYDYTDMMADLKLQSNCIFAWHGNVYDYTELMGKPMEAIQLRKHNEEVPFYLMAYCVGKKYYIRAEYNANQYSETLIAQIMQSYEATLEGFLTQTRLHDISICTKIQCELLERFNQTDVDYDDSQTIVSLFRRQAAQTPDNIAVVYQDKRITYREVDEISDRIATYIHTKGLHDEDVVSVLIPRCEWMPIISLGVLKAGCAYQPLDPTYPSERLNFMMEDAAVKLLIADTELRSLVDHYIGDVLLTSDIAALTADNNGLNDWAPKPQSLFIMLYTSGTTGVPKGCQLIHRNVVTFCAWYQRRFNLTAGCRVTAYASYGFDANIMDTYPALTCGATVYIIPEELRLDLVALNEYFEREQITHGFMTTQVGYQFAASIENHSLRYLLTGGEKLAAIAPPTNYTLVNLYGPTESTVCITAFDVTKPMKDIPIGAAIDNVKLYIVDKDGHRLPVGAAGELWVAGPQVSRGYLNRPDKTAEVYIDNPFANGKYQRVYRTGDIVRYLPDGNIQFVGRKDGQVKIRGFRIELKEVEGVIRQFPGIKDATVQAFDEPGGGKFIAAYIVSDETVDIKALNDFILEEKPPYMVPAVTMQIERIPLNQNQKVNKKALPKPEKKATETEGESNVQMNKLEQELHDLIANIVNTNDFGINTTLGYAGLTSISAIKLAVQLNKRYGITTDSRLLAKSYTLQDIENDITEFLLAGGTKGASAPDSQTAKPVKTSVPLSYPQTGVYVDCMNNPDSTLYNIPMKLSLPTQVDAEQLKEAVTAIIKSHPLLSVHFDNESSETMQVTDPEQEVAIPVLAMSEEELEAHQQDFVKPFNLEQGPLYRAEIVKTPQRLYLLSDFHHLIADGGSCDLFYRQLCSALAGEPVEPETLSYADYVTAEKEAAKGEEFAAAKAFFDKQLDGCDGATEIIPDLPNPQEGGTLGATHAPIDMPSIEDCCRKLHVTPAHFTLAATLYTLSRFTNSERLCITTISNGRSNLRIAGTMGMFVNTLPITSQIGSQTVEEYVCQTSNEFVETIRHENYPFAQIATDYELVPEMIFAYQMGIFESYMYQGNALQVESLELKAPRFHISILIKEYEGVPSVCLEYDNGLYSQQLMQSLANSISHVAQAFVASPKEPLTNITLTDDRDTQLLDSFNDNDRPYDDTQTIVSLFRRQAKATPDKTAVVFKDKKFTYAELDNISDHIASYIASKGLGLEDVVAVLIARSEWMAIASLGVLKAGCAYQPLDPTYPKERLNFMMQDTASRLLIADENLCSIVDEYKGEVLLTKDIDHLPLNIDHLTPKPESLFTLIYTSGSTGVPKGCQLEHRNMVAFCHMHTHAMHLEADSRVGAYASFGFDACLLELWAPLMVGATVYIIPEEIRLDLLALNDYFEQNGITHTFMTTQVARSFVNDIANHSLKAFITGGEKLSDVTPPPYLLLNGYGPSESICYVTAFAVKEKLQNIPIGKAVENMHLYIMDAQGHRLPLGAAGELWVSGPQVGRGYLNRPEKTAESFIETPWGRCYRTGDIVRYLPDGNIQFVGRRDGQVKIRGFRIELKEVEAIIREFPGIKDATVQAFDEDGGGKFIAAYIVSDEKVDIKELNNFILEEKPPYMVPAVTMQIESIPLNQNQKVNKKALPKPEKKAAEAVAESNVPMNVLEKELHGIIAKIINNKDFGVTTVLGFAGLTSIMAIKLAVQINKRFGVTLDSKSLVKTGSLQSIENEILAKMMEVSPALLAGKVSLSPSEEGTIPAASAKQPDGQTTAPLSYAQMGVYVDCMKQPTATVYNIPSLIRFPKETDVELLEKSIDTLIKAHPQFHVHFDSEKGEIVQIIDTSKPIVITKSELSEEELEKYKVGFVKPFNLRQGPLCHIEIVTTEQNVCLLTDMHHLVFDGGSFDLFLNQLCDLMNGGEIEPEMMSYADFVADEKTAENTPSYIEAKNFFNERLSNVEGVTEVPADLTNPIDQGAVSETFCKMDFDALQAFCKKHNLSAAHLTLAAVFYTLSRFTNNEQVCITTISNGRADLRISNTTGMFVNTLALSAQIGKGSVMDFVKETGKNFEETLMHEKYPFAQIANDYDLSAEIMFAYQMGVIDEYLVNGKKLEIESLELNTPKFRIAFYIEEKNGVPGVLVEYDNGRYSQQLMESLAQSICNAVSAFIQQPQADLQKVSLLDAEQTDVLNSFNQTEVDYDNTQNVVSLFRRQVEEVPGNIAVVYHDVRLTYKQVDEMSERIAQYIQSLGLRAEDVVSVLIPRSEWMVLASLGVLKAGCAYQPLDPSYPAERLNFMMQDASAKLLITDEELRPLVNEYQGKVLFTKDIDALPEATTPVQADITPSSLFIMLYTSGSTGVPKGCQLEHGNLVCFCHWYQRYYNLTADSHVAAYASYGFDACMMDMYPALTCGACVYIIGEDIRLNLPDLNDYFNREGITHSFMTTQVGCQFAMNFDNHSLLHLSVGGEKVLPLTPPTSYQLHNGYGPTECTIFTTTYPMKEFEQNAPIGKPLDNLRLYIVDKQLNRLPVGAMGELWVSGPQVSRGYLNRPEKTAETYLTNPFTTEAKYSRVYRTGDIVRYLSDGNIQFVGRRDGQVKIRGFRIELKEVEAVIRQYPGIKDATVQAFDYENGGKYIAAYIVSDEQVNIKELNAFIGKQKPSYMIPAATMQIDSIPLNQNQKVNRKALPTPVILAADHEYVEPKNEQERLFAKIFGDILMIDKVSATDNFFELGGTSLMVTKVIIECDKAGYHVIYGDVFTHATPRLLAQFVNGEAPTEDADTDITNFDYTDIDDMLKRNNIETFLKGERQQLGHVLLTGATGYLGIHVLRELIDSDAATITCMVRGKDLTNAEHRLKNLLFYYFEKSFKDIFGSRLFVINSDVTKEINVDRHIDTVFNCAANVKHFSKGNDIEDVNIGGAQRCVEFCLKTGARLVHISTTSVGEIWIIHNDGEQVPMLDERKLWFGQFLDNRYINSKFLAERAVLDAVAHHGLSAKVMRVGNLAPRSYDGEFQANFNSNSYMGRLKVFHVLGCCPYDSYDELTEMSPIDQTAKAVVLLSSTPKECTLFQPFNNHTELLGDVLQLMAKVGRDIRFVETEEFKKAIDEAGQDPEKAKLLSSILAYQDVAHGQKAAIIERDNRYTCNVLHRLGFHWRDTSWDYVERMLTAIGGFGFFGE